MYSQDDIFSRHLRATPAFRAILRSIEVRMMMQLDFPEPVLDFGCGDGYFGYMSLKSGSAIGIDPNKSSLNEAAQKAVELSKK